MMPDAATQGSGSGLRIQQFTADEVLRNWPWCEQLLAPSLAFTPQTSSDGVKAALMSGEMGLASVHIHGGTGLFIAHVGVFDGVLACWVPYIVAFSRMGPKNWLKTIRAITARIEDSARSIGCAEVRVGGRDWSRVLIGYAPFDDKPNRLRKVL